MGHFMVRIKNVTGKWAVVLVLADNTTDALARAREMLTTKADADYGPNSEFRPVYTMQYDVTPFMECVICNGEWD